MEKTPSIAIIGGGVIGITTGIILNIHGYKTKVYTEHLVDEESTLTARKTMPELASIYAAASIIPHSVNHPNSEKMLKISQKFFHRLAFAANCGVRVQRHYELFEYKLNPPKYSQAVQDITMLVDDGSAWQTDENIPKRKDANGVWGWYFNTFFAEGPTYLKRLYDLYQASGGTILHKKINLENLMKLNGDIVVNCTGRWAINFYPEDKKNTHIVRGHMVKMGLYEVPHDKRNQYFSYNYSPSPNVYSRHDKEKGIISADVYFYPRSDGWLLGGSRQEGYPEIGQPWRQEDEQTVGDTFKLPGWQTEIPKPIWDINRELILDITHPKIDIADKKYKSSAFIGYRFSRDPIRIEKDFSNKSKLVIHNYGHGGAGYTLSWGSAYEVLKIISIETGYHPHFINREISDDTNLTLLSILEDLARKEYEKNLA